MTRDPLMPEVLDGFDRALRRTPARRRWFAPRAFGVALVGLALGGTAIAAVAPWNPMGSNSGAATTSPPPPDQLRTLGVLRRPQTDRDRGALITAMLNRAGLPHEGKVRLPYVRHLRDVEMKLGMVLAGGKETGTIGTASLYLVPRTARPNPKFDRYSGPLQFCLSSVYDSWPDPATTPPDIIQQAKQARRPVPARPTALADRLSGGGTCGSAHNVRMKGLSTGGAFSGNVTGIVPDGVSAVRALTRDGQPVQARVTDNSFQLLAPGRNLPPDPHDRDDRPWAPPLSGQFKSGTYEWLDASGKVIRKMPY